MVPARHRALLLIPLATLATACGAARGGIVGRSVQHASENPAAGHRVADPVAPAQGEGATGSGLSSALATARHIYANEMNGARVHADLRMVATDGALLADLRRGALAAAQARAYHDMVGKPMAHITRISVVRGHGALINAVWNDNGSFVVAPLTERLDANGDNLGTLLVSVQDIIGYIKLIHAYTGAQAVVRGTSGQARASMPAALARPLPSAGEVTIAGARYRVGSFHLVGWGSESEPLTVWVLVRA